MSTDLPMCANFLLQRCNLCQGFAPYCELRPCFVIQNLNVPTYVGFDLGGRWP
jgi:hypothetical protein